MKAEAWATLRIAFDEISLAVEESREVETIDERIAAQIEEGDTGDRHTTPTDRVFEDQMELPDYWDGKADRHKHAYRVRRIEAVIERLRDAITDRTEDQVKTLFRSVQELVTATRISYDGPLWDAIDESLDILSMSEPVLIFAPPPPAIHIPKLIVGAQEAMIEALRREPQSIFKIPSRAFEELIAEIFKQKGFAVELTKATRDGGRDIVAVHEVLGIRSKYIVECKRYAAHRKVSVELVQRLYGVKMSEGANKAILATTSSFTRDATEFASRHLWDLELKAYGDILDWIRESTQTI